jgi:DNA invertase Pin-like site-specific DNA recombinase
MAKMPATEAPAPSHWVAYYRVSTDRQGCSGLGLEAQRSSVLTYLARIGGTLAAEFTEVESGKRADRPELLAALAICRRRKIPLIIAKLDRLARNVAFVSNLMESKIEFLAVDMPEASPFTIHILAAVAEHERKLASIRTREALQAAKARGKRLGSPRIEDARAAHVAASDAFAAGVWPHIEELTLSGLSLRKIAAELNERAIKTRTGKAWEASTVRNVILWSQRTN